MIWQIMREMRDLDYMIEYDMKDPISIESYAKRLIGKTFLDIIEEDEAPIDEFNENIAYAVSHEDKKYKGGLGTLIEERFFHYKANSDDRPDFPEAGVELKVTPYKKRANGKYQAKERLILTMIDYFKVVGEEFEESHLWRKARLILLVYYLYSYLYYF